MTKSYFPFDAGAGANVIEDQWAKMARTFAGTGVVSNQLNELEVFADNTGMQVKVKSGQAFVEGFFFESDAQETLVIASSDLSNPRKDLVIVRLNRTANTIDLAVLTGTPAGSPVAPSLTQNSTTWEIALAEILVNNAVVSITADKVTDKRVRSDAGFYELGTGSDGNATISGTVNVTRDMHYNNLTIQAGANLKTNGFIIRVKGTLSIAATGKLSADGTDGSNANVGNGGAGGAGSPRGTIGGGSDGGNGGSSSGGSGAGAKAGGVAPDPYHGDLPNRGGGGGGGGGATTAAGTAGTSPNFTGGAKGGNGGTPSSNSSSAGGGGGGGGGGVILIYCNVIDNAGTISAIGGRGGNAHSGTALGGAGGGGGGGHIAIFYKLTTGSGIGTLTAAGGLGGAVGSGGTAGVDGTTQTVQM